MTDHPDLEALSAAVDGEDPLGAVASHVGACADCRAQIDALHLARRAVAAPVPPLAGEARERMMAAALDAAGGEHVAEPAAAAAPAAAGPAPAPAPVVPLPVPREPRKWWLGGAAAAAVLAVVVGAAGMLGRGTDEGTDTALSGGGGAGAAAEFESPTMAAGPPPAGAPRVTEAGDLGDVPNVESLRSRVAVANATSRANRGAAAPAGTAQDSLATAAPTTVPAPVPREIGTRPCEEQARTARPQVGGLVYVATARFAGTPAIVLGFAASAEGPPATVLVLAESGCRLLAETSVP